MMDKFSKLMILLEMKGIDISPILKLEKNELLLLGANDIAEDVKYKDLINNYQNYLNPLNGKDNPFYMGLGVKKQASFLGDIIIHNYKTNTFEKIDDILLNDDFIDTTKHDIIYRGYQQICNEYKDTLNNFINHDIASLSRNFKIREIYLGTVEPKRALKGNFRFWFCSVLLLLFNYFFLQRSFFIENKFYYLLNNFVFNMFLLFPFVKIIYYYVLHYQSSYYQRKVSYINEKYELLKDFHDKQIDRLEKDLFYYYGNNQKNIAINYLAKTNIKLKKIHKMIRKTITNRFTERLFNIIDYIIKVINILVPLLFVLLVVMYFLHRLGVDLWMVKM